MSPRSRGKYTGEGWRRVGKASPRSRQTCKMAGFAPFHTLSLKEGKEPLRHLKDLQSWEERTFRSIMRQRKIVFIA